MGRREIRLSRAEVSAGHSLLLRWCAKSNSAFSLRPQSGERRSAADRSSSCCSTKQPSAIRSITAICSGQADAVGPGPGTLRSLSWADHFAAERFTPRSRIMMSFGEIDWSCPGRRAPGPYPAGDALRYLARQPRHRGFRPAPHPPAPRDRSLRFPAAAAPAKLDAAFRLVAMGFMVDRLIAIGEAVARTFRLEDLVPQIAGRAARSGAR